MAPAHPESIPDLPESNLPVADLARPVPSADTETSVNRIKQMFCNTEPISAVVITSKGAPVGLVMNLHLDKVLSHRFGVSLYYDKPISKVMDDHPLIVDGDTAIARVADMAMDRDMRHIYDHVIVMRNEKIKGIVSVRSLMNKLIDIHETHARQVNGINDQLKSEISHKAQLEQQLVMLNRDLEFRVEKRTEELRQANDRLKKAVDEAQSANRAKSAFLAGMSHELRTPLNHIIGFTQIIAAGQLGDVNDVQKEYLTDVVNSSKHLLSLINDILDLSKVEAGKLDLSLSDIHIADLLKGSLTMVKEKALKNSIAITADINHLPEIISSDERKVKQIVYNLLSNAVKFTPAGGEIRLSAGYDVQGNLIHVTVSDSGIGIKKEDQERIFHPFVQVDGSASRQFQGTGLGLSLTRKLVTLLKGDIWVESTGDGTGSAFHFTLPLGSKDPDGMYILPNTEDRIEAALSC